MNLRNALIKFFTVVSLSVGSMGLAADGAPTLSIVYTAPHPVINDIILGFKEVVTRDYPAAKFTERHAEGRPEQYGAVVLAAIGDRPQVLVPITTPITKLAVDGARRRIPVVFMGVTDPVGAGVAVSIEKPEVSTGSSDLCPFSALLELARKTLPNAKSLGLPYNPTDQPAVFGRSQLISIAPKYGFTIVDRQVTAASELSTVVKGLAQGVDGVIIAADNLMMENPAAVASSAREQGKPTFACDKASVEAGAVAGVGVEYKDVGRLAGERAVRVLKGESAGSIPVAVLSSGSIVINKRAACAFDLPIARSVDRAGTVVLHFAEECPPARAPDTVGTGIYWLVGGGAGICVLILLLRRRKKHS